jgi:hypothetical protein
VLGQHCSLSRHVRTPTFRKPAITVSPMLRNQIRLKRVHGATFSKIAQVSDREDHP